MTEIARTNGLNRIAERVTWMAGVTVLLKHLSATVPTTLLDGLGLLVTAGTNCLPSRLTPLHFARDSGRRASAGLKMRSVHYHRRLGH